MISYANSSDVYRRLLWQFFIICINFSFEVRSLNSGYTLIVLVHRESCKYSRRWQQYIKWYSYPKTFPLKNHMINFPERRHYARQFQCVKTIQRNIANTKRYPFGKKDDTVFILTYWNISIISGRHFNGCYFQFSSIILPASMPANLLQYLHTLTHRCLYTLCQLSSPLLTHRGPVDLRKWAFFNTILMSPKSWLSQEDLDAGCEHSLVPVDS